METRDGKPVLWREIARSWMAMKLWVKVWLFFLNAVMLAGAAFRYDPIGYWTLVAYVASGPLLAGFMIRQRGLTRLLGVAHLVPWTPLLVYIVLRLTTTLVGSQLAPAQDPGLFWWTLLLTATVGICLAFDAYDAVRWMGGQTFVLGSEQAHRAGASSLARQGTRVA